MNYGSEMSFVSDGLIGWVDSGRAGHGLSWARLEWGWVGLGWIGLSWSLMELG